MFGDNDFLDTVAERMLDQFDLQEILDLNDLTDQEALRILIGAGHVTAPERFFDPV